MIKSVIRPGTRVSAMERKKLTEGQFCYRGVSRIEDRQKEAGSLTVHLREHWDKISEIPANASRVGDESHHQATIDPVEGDVIYHIDSTGKRVLTSSPPRVGIGWFPVEAVAFINLVDIRTSDASAMRIALSDAILNLAAQEKSRYQALLIHAGGAVDTMYRYDQTDLTVIPTDDPCARQIGFSLFRCLGLAVEGFSPKTPPSEG